MKIIKENNKRISEETIRVPFEMSRKQDKIITFDKVITGNGGSTAFLRLPVKEGTVNLMLAPNVAVVKDKEAQYIKDEFGFFQGKDMRFIYGGALDKNIGANEEGRHPDTIVMVIDSFFSYAKQLQDFNVDLILIDEAHSIIQQSAFRRSLVDFSRRVKSLFPVSSIVMLTATPTLYMDVDVKVQMDSKYIKGFDIHHTQDRDALVQQIKRDVSVGGNVVVFTNNHQVVKALRNGKHPLDARFIIGASMMDSLGSGTDVTYNNSSKLTCSSSRGFEGFDIMYKNANVYFFEDRSKDHESFYPSNLIQASGRTRLGAERITYCRLPVDRKQKDAFQDIDAEVDSFINDKRYSPEAKMSKNIASKPNNQKSKKKDNPYLKYIIQETGKDGRTSIVKNKQVIDLYKESRICDRDFPQKEYETFFKERGIRIVKDESTKNRNRMNKVNDIEKIKRHLFHNKDIFAESEQYGESYRIKWDFNLKKLQNSKGGLNAVREKMHYDYEVYLAKKNYDRNYTVLPHQDKISKLLSFTVSASGELVPNGTFEALREELVQMKNEKLKEKATSVEDQQQKLDEFEQYSVINLYYTLMIMAHEKAYVPAWRTMHRDYNFSTAVPYRMIEHVMNYLEVSVDEVDIVTCNPRILYAKCGLNLPKDFYGENKKNKQAISKLLNDFMYSELKDTPYKVQKSRSKKALKKYGVDPIVIKYLMDEYFEVKMNYRGQFTSDCSFHEMKIIEALAEEMDSELNDGVIRRHDSIVIFNNEQPLGFLDTWHYDYFQDARGWFKRDVVEEIDSLLEENDILVAPEVIEEDLSGWGDAMSGTNDRREARKSS